MSSRFVQSHKEPTGPPAPAWSTSRVMSTEFLKGIFTVDCLATVRFVGVYNGRYTLLKVTISVPPSLSNQVSQSRGAWW